MRYRFYSKTNQILMEAAIVGASFFLAYEIRYEGAVPAYQIFQFWTLVIPIAVGRLVTNYLFGLNQIQWRHVSLRDVSPVAMSYFTFSLLLLVARYGLSVGWGIARIPLGVIMIEFLLSLLGALGIRMLRRLSYERHLIREESKKTKDPRRLLLIGAGVMGANVAKEMASHSSTQIVGFLDDDPGKFGCVIAGKKVLGPSSLLTEVVKTEKIDHVLICIAPAARGSFNRLLALLEGMPVTSKFVPTITEILDSQDGLHLSLGDHNGNGNGNSAKSTPSQVSPPAQRTEIRNKNILITGGAGFIGSSLAERLARNNGVVLLDRLFQNQPVAFTSLQKNPNVRFVEADILETKVLNSEAAEADIVIHAAAIVGVGRVCNYPRETLETNFEGTSRILKALERNRRLERFVYFSTSEVFGVNSFRVHEDTPTAVGPAAEARWSYAIAKLAGEHLVKAYHRQANMPVATVRPFNVFGPRRLGSHAILGFVLNALAGTPLEVHGDGSQIRSWCYIEDFCDALIEMIARPSAIGEDFNIGNPANTLTVFQLAQKVVELTGGRSSIMFMESPFPDIEIRVPSLEKARQILGFQPKYDIDRGLELTVDWYREHLSFFESKLSRAVAATRSD